jgi:hypothetical protein
VQTSEPVGEQKATTHNCAMTRCRVDGVATNGVSGGPAFDPQGLVVGFVTSYMPNRVRADTTLPGLMVVTPLNLVRLWMQELLGAQVKFRDSK